jgi:sulfite reductase (NADPH) flavoprotein alpha-component
LGSQARLPASAPFPADDIESLNRIVERATPLQRSWLSGFLAGLDASVAAQSGAAQIPRAKSKLTILYASESGNAEGLALKARKIAQKQGFNAVVLDMAEADLSALPDVQNLIVFASTWGEGDPPQRAADFYASLMSEAAPRIDGVRFAVLALGDKAYVNFCSTGRAVDERLAALGGKRMLERIELDLDFARSAAAWTEQALVALTPQEPSTTVVHVDVRSAPDPSDGEPVFDAANPLTAEITELVNLNGSRSASETWHVELATEAPGFAYEPGDAIGVIPENDPELAEALLVAVGLGGHDVLFERLLTELDITTLTRSTVENYAKLTGKADVVDLTAPERFAAYATDRQLIDLFVENPVKLTPDELTGLLRPLPPRLYSVASSLKAHPGETHLLVSAVRWAAHERARKGVASVHIADRSKKGSTLKVYVKPNRHFRLPNDPAARIIMIGAGTGVAPFRGFVEDRAESGATGASWLFFGARNYVNDFLYQLEWQDHLKNGALGRIDVAFSRDQPEKMYVQHRLLARADELLGWIEDGAHVYVCGDEKGMARDVDTALARILSRDQGSADLDEGRTRLKALAKAGRYQRDVY